VGREEAAIMFWSQLLLWLSGLPFLFFGILGIMWGVILAASDEYDDAVGVIFIVGGITLTLVGSVLWSCASWRFYRDNKK
jgi:hypothetical protein